MFGVGLPEVIMILIVALIVLGPKRLPEIAKGLGKALGEFQRATSGLADELGEEALSGNQSSQRSLTSVMPPREKASVARES